MLLKFSSDLVLCKPFELPLISPYFASNNNSSRAFYNFATDPFLLSYIHSPMNHSSLKKAPNSEGEPVLCLQTTLQRNKCAFYCLTL